jgi:hypothetical protein
VLTDFKFELQHSSPEVRALVAGITRQRGLYKA